MAGECEHEHEHELELRVNGRRVGEPKTRSPVLMLLGVSWWCRGAAGNRQAKQVRPLVVRRSV